MQRLLLKKILCKLKQCCLHREVERLKMFQKVDSRRGVVSRIRITDGTVSVIPLVLLVCVGGRVTEGAD